MKNKVVKKESRKYRVIAKPLEMIVLGALFIVLAAVLEALLPSQKQQAIGSEALSLSVSGLLGLCGAALLLWPIVKRGFELWKNR